MSYIRSVPEHEGAPTPPATPMARALALGRRARGRTAPNPWVGCVLVRDGEVVGEGATEPPGGPHAEAVALGAAGERARGATAHVTLEPCSHHGRTPPCADALVAAGVARVVVALEDPDPVVAGTGLAHLRAHGVDVTVGEGAEEAARDLLPYLVHRRLGRAATVVKLAASIDGRTAAADGSSQWITGPEARADVHRRRAESQAVVVGSGTALADRPTLTARDVAAPPACQPLRVLLDGRGRVPADGPLFDPALAPTLVLTTGAAPDDAVAAWWRAGADVHALPPAPDGDGVDLVAALALLGRRGVLQALVEPGPTLAGALVDAGLVDRLLLYVGPALLGIDGRPSFATAGPATIADASRWRLVDVARVGDDVRLEYEPVAGTA
jgi:diaminohydroxyphosphoribosylaminopyrimidine deaminase / 5-amino-6-(5-phosphoribosylamino)uracil reductase